MSRSHALRLAVAVAVASLGGVAACAPSYQIVRQAPAAPFAASHSVSIEPLRFERLRINSRAEEDYLAGRGPEEIVVWEELKHETSARFRTHVTAKAKPLTVRLVDLPPGAAAARVLDPPWPSPASEAPADEGAPVASPLPSAPAASPPPSAAPAPRGDGLVLRCYLEDVETDTLSTHMRVTLTAQLIDPRGEVLDEIHVEQKANQNGLSTTSRLAPRVRQAGADLGDAIGTYLHDRDRR